MHLLICEKGMDYMKRMVIGVLAHVDAGKTTLSEALLYTTGSIRNFGRVDHGDAFLDTFALERQRGITIFSKQAVLEAGDIQATLLDTPGHVDFSAEMERTLSVLDCAILVVSAPAGVQSHTKTLWKLLRSRGIPTFLFLNKMDLPCPERSDILRELKRMLGDGIVDLEQPDPEALALGSEALLEEYLETGAVSEASLAQAVAQCKLFPCWFGAALRLQGVEGFWDMLTRLAPCVKPREAFGAKVFKISRDEQGVRLSHLKVTGGVLRVRDVIAGEKVTQLRRYSGAKFQAVEEALPGQVVAVVGLNATRAGTGLGCEALAQPALLEPVLSYGVELPEGFDPVKALAMFRQLEEEDPQLHVDWEEHRREIRVRLMGAVQLEVLTQVLQDRFGLSVTFTQGGILYKETIANTVEGVGHYEPLRHYAEVHLLLEPAPRGSGIRLDSACREDDLDRNWQRLILTHLAEKQHLGVLTGSPITDLTITLVSGKAHLKHTEGGDFRQATYRAVRQGLMQAESVLLEPWYDFRLELPQGNVGRAMTDLQQMGASFDPPEIVGEEAVLTGAAPVSAMQDYPQTVTAYTRGLGRISCTLRGYEPCKNQQQVVEALGYDPEADLDNSPDSIFCSHGAGINVKWNEVPEHMHLPSALEPPVEEPPLRDLAAEYCAIVATDKELMQIFERTYGPIRRDKTQAMRTPKSHTPAKPYRGSPQPQGPEYLLVDGYNIIFAWDELKKLSEKSLEDARGVLIDRLRNYQGFHQKPVIVVFDAYKVKGNPGSVEHHGGLSVVYTKEAETADQYIEKVTHELGKKHKVRVATSDALEQIIILGHGALRISARAFHQEVEEAEAAIRDFLSGST